MIQTWSWCWFQHYRGRGFQINQNKSLDLDVWPWELRSNIYLYDFQGQPSRSRDLFWFIWDPQPRECWNQHQDLFCSMYTTRDNRGHVGVCLTLIFKVKGQGHEINFSFFDIPDLKNARIDTKIKFVSRFLQEVTKVIPIHMYDLDFQGQPSRSEHSF